MINLENKNLNYYDELFSYLKTITNLTTKKGTSMEEYVVKEVFNGLVSNYKEEDIKKLVFISSFFDNMISKMNDEEKEKFINELYLTYIKSMVNCFQIGDNDAVKVFFNRLKEKVEIISGYNAIYGFHDEIENSNVKSR